MEQLSYVPFEELKRVCNLQISEEKKVELFANLCRINILYMVTKAGSGHLGTSLSSVDIMSWLFLQEMNIPSPPSPDKGDIFFSSKGHDAPSKYSVLLGLGFLNFDLIHQLRRLGGLPGHPDVKTPWMHTNTGSLGMGISKAHGMAFAKRLKNEKSNFYVLTGDGELQEGQFWESLQPAANQGYGEITVIVDHNKVQSDIWVKQVSDLGTLEKKLASFGWHVARCDGHNFSELKKVLEEFKKIQDKPKILIADTIKGKGVSFMESTSMKETDRLYRFHSGAPDYATYSRALEELVSKVNVQLHAADTTQIQLNTSDYTPKKNVDHCEKLVNAYSNALVEQAEKNSKIISLDADLALDTGLLAFEEKFPTRFHECGIAEQDMVSQAGGMALQGLLPIVHSFGCFLSARPNEQIYNNATEHTKVIYVGSLIGLLPSGPGHSHQCVRDISVLSSTPDFIMIEPSCEKEVSLALDYLVNQHSGSSYLRLVSIPCEIPYSLPEKHSLKLGQGISLQEGKDAIIFGYGPVLLPQAYLASKILKEKHNISLEVVNLPWLNRVDSAWLKAIIGSRKNIFTLDNHYLSGGQGEMLMAELSKLQFNQTLQVKQFGVEEIPRCGLNDEVLKAHRLDAESLVEEISQRMKS